MQNFDRAFEGVIAWITILLVLVSLTYSCIAKSDALPPAPHGITKMIRGKKHECFDTEAYRVITQYVQVIAPSLKTKNRILKSTLTEAYKENSRWQDTASLLQNKIDVVTMDLAASRAELTDIKLQIKDYQSDRKRITVVHYLFHSLAAVALVSLGTVYTVERLK